MAGRGRPKGAKDTRPRKRGTSAVKIGEGVADERDEIALLACAGLTDVEIARHCRIDIETLRARFGAELTNCDAAARAQNLARLNKAADAGNVSAMKTIHEIISQASAERNVGAPEQPDMIAALGKKERRQLEADSAGRGTSWGLDLETPTTH